MKIIVLDYETGDFIDIFKDDLPDYGEENIKRRVDPEAGLSILWINEQRGERNIKSFTFNESIDYVTKALDDGKYQDAYKNYLIEVLKHMENIFPEPVENKQ